MTTRFRDLLSILLLAALATLPYLPALDGPFVIDDVRFIADNDENLGAWNRPWVYFTDPTTNADLADGDIYRPLRTWSFAIDRRLFGDDTFGYHLHSVLLHALVVLLLWRLARRPDGSPSGVRLLACALFAAHPLATEAVAWISSRADLQAAAMVLAALLAARAAERRVALLPAVFTLGLACGFAKETAVMVPALAMVERRWRLGRWSGPWAPTIALGAGVAVYLAVYLGVTERGLTGQVGWYEGSLARHLPYTAVGLLTHLRLFVWPSGLTPLWETNLFVPLGVATVATAVLVLAGVTTLAIGSRRRRPIVAAGITFWAIALLPAANLLLPLRTVLAERFAYLPLIGLCAAAAALLEGTTRRIPAPVRLALAAAIVLTAAVGTARRAADWSDQERLHRATMEAHPQSYAAAFGLGGVLLDDAMDAFLTGDTIGSTRDAGAAAESFERARKIAGDELGRSVDATFGLGRALVIGGDFVRAIEVLTAVDALLSANPEFAATSRHAPESRFQLGLALTRRSRLAEAEEVFGRLIRIHGETARRLDAYGEVLRARRDGQALQAFERAVILDPDYHAARIHLAEMLRAFPGYEGAARRHLKEVLHRDPTNARARALFEQWEAESSTDNGSG